MPEEEQTDLNAWMGSTPCCSHTQLNHLCPAVT